LFDNQALMFVFVKVNVLEERKLEFLGIYFPVSWTSLGNKLTKLRQIWSCGGG